MADDLDDLDRCKFISIDHFNPSRPLSEMGTAIMLENDLEKCRTSRVTFKYRRSEETKTLVVKNTEKIRMYVLPDREMDMDFVQFNFTSNSTVYHV